ncbi:MAG: P-loop NTPase [Deltaproteobacteria bacterium]|nr:P-loop NTPase [Deltaproteobacteria bacterium]
MGEITPSDKRFNRDFPETTMRDIYAVLFRHKSRAIIFFCTVMITVIIGIFLSSDVYQSDAKLLVRLGRESVSLDPTASTGRVMNISQDWESGINSELEILNSRKLAEKVVDATGVDMQKDWAAQTPLPDDSVIKKLRYIVKQTLWSPLVAFAKPIFPSQPITSREQLQDRDVAIRSFMEKLKVETIKKSNILLISYESNSPQLARDQVEKFIQFYLDEHISAHRTSGSYAFFNSQAETFRSALALGEENLKNLKSQTGMASLQEQRRILLDRIGNLQRDLELTDAASVASTAKIKVMKNTLASLPSTMQREETTGFANSSTDELLRRLNDLQMKEHELLSTFTENSVPVVELRRQIREAQSLLSKAQQPRQVTRAANPTYQQLQLEFLSEDGQHSSLLAKAEAQKQQLARAKNELETVNESEMKLTNLERELDLLRANYRKYSESMEQARIDQALEMDKISNISIVQPPSYPVKPIRPRVALNLVMGLFLGLFGGIGLAFVSEYLDHSIKKPEEVEQRLQLPILASIPYWHSNGAVKADGKTSMQGYIPYLQEMSETPQNCPLELRKIYETFINRLNSPACGNFETLHAISLTSCHPGEGNSTVAAHLALMLANCGEGRILLVDANIHHPSVHRIFDVDLSPGLTDIFRDGQGNMNLIRPSRINYLDLLCAGRAEADSSWRFDSKTFAELLKLWKREYSFVIFDSPAVWEGNYADSLGTLVDAVILVAEAEKVRWETAQRAKDLLIEARANVLGIVLNKRQFYIPEWLYRMV